MTFTAAPIACSRAFSPTAASRVQYVDFADESALKAALTPAVKLVYLESPTNPLLHILDLARVATLAHEHGARVCVDNSTMSPYLQRPLELGCDIVIHSATKFLCGHSDVMAGAVIVRDAGLVDDLYLIQNGEGGGLAPFRQLPCAARAEDAGAAAGPATGECDCGGAISETASGCDRRLLSPRWRRRKRQRSTRSRPAVRARCSVSVPAMRSCRAAWSKRASCIPLRSALAG